MKSGFGFLLLVELQLTGNRTAQLSMPVSTNQLDVLWELDTQCNITSIHYTQAAHDPICIGNYLFCLEGGG